MAGAAKKMPEVTDWEDLLEIKDLRSAYCLMKEWKMDMSKEAMSSVKNHNDAIDKLIRHWISVHGDIQISKSQKSHGFEDAVVKHHQVRAKLVDSFDKSHRFYRNLVPLIQKNLENSFQGLNEKFEEKKESLKTGECTILMLGEVGAGKSSLVNLLLGVQLFPTDGGQCTNTICEIHRILVNSEVGAGKSSLVNLLLGVQLFPTDGVQCTNTICEIRCSSGGQKEARLVPKSEMSDSGNRDRKVSPRTLNLSSLKALQELKDCIVESNEDGDNPYERIEIYWPFQMLGKGVVIVDTPGIEGGSNVDHRLSKYLTKAFGFIYVINTNAAGGVQRRLCHLLNMVVNSSEDFSPDASLFICNKWENVPDTDKEDVRKNTFHNLSRIYPGITTDQLHFMSVKKCTGVSMTYNARIRQHKVLLQKLENLVPNCLVQGLASQYCWLATVLKRVSYLLRVTSVQHAMSTEDLEKQRRELKDHVVKLQRNTDESLARLRDTVEYEVFRINNELKEALNTTRFLSRLCDWSDVRQCPNKQRNWKMVADEAAVRIADRVTREIDAWERENRKLEKIDGKIVDVFSKEMGLMEHQVRDLEDMLLRNRGGHGVFFHTMKTVPVKALFGRKKKQIEKTYSTLGGAVSCIGMLDTTNKEVRGIFREYGDNSKGKKMEEATVLYLQAIINHRDLQGKLRKFFTRFFKEIDEAAKLIPKYLQADQQLLETVGRKIEDISRASDKFPEQIGDLSKLKSSLDILYVNSIMKFDFEPGELDMDRKKHLGSGAFANVYETVIKAKNKPVAIKVTKDIVSHSTITDILMEDRTMRDLKHAHVVRYYGATYIYHEKSIRYVMVMERCVKSLRDVYTAGSRVEAYIPGAHVEGAKSRQSAVRKMATHGYQLSLGLEYIHARGYTHRDIKLENILLAVDDTVKITDVGIAKPTEVLLTTCNGSPAYMAPEVLLGTRNHCNKIDIYSLAFILWEMWFGRDVTDDMNDVILGGGFQGDAMSKLKERQGRQDGGYRPSLKAANRPPLAFVNMLKDGWHYDPDARPSATAFVTFFKNFLANN